MALPPLNSTIRVGVGNVAAEPADGAAEAAWVVALAADAPPSASAAPRTAMTASGLRISRMGDIAIAFRRVGTGSERRHGPRVYTEVRVSASAADQ